MAVPLQKPDMQVKHDLQGVGSSLPSAVVRTA
jgi:hypothetical protein